MSDSRPEDVIVFETERVEITRGINDDGDTITVIQASTHDGGTPPRFLIHGMLGVAGYYVNREDWP